jgi:hypothetical protein
VDFFNSYAHTALGANGPPNKKKNKQTITLEAMMHIDVKHGVWTSLTAIFTPQIQQSGLPTARRTEEMYSRMP